VIRIVMTSHEPTKRKFQLTFEDQRLTFWIEYSRGIGRDCVNGPEEKLGDRKLIHRSRTAAVEVARAMGLLEK
jgi:hypothetical protein